MGSLQEGQETKPQQASSSINPRDWVWGFWPLVPLYPYSKRRTVRTEAYEDTIWTFDQIQGILYTVVPIRMTVVKLSKGGLLVYAPIAPTKECIKLVKELVAIHGNVRYIILPTASGLEHKVFVGPFARQFPSAQVFVTPSQWSYPINLPLSWLGFPRNRTHVLPEDSSLAPFADDFEYAILDINLGRGSFVEVALFHKNSRTLLLTDTVLAVPEAPPPIVQLDSYALLFHARDTALDVITDSEENRSKGWQRICLFALYFAPSALEPVSLKQAFRDALKAPDRSKKAYFGLFPFRWKDDWQRSFDRLRGGGRPFVAPILQIFILDHAPKKTLDWADKVASWNFQQIIACHFDAPIQTSPYQFRQAFSFLENEQTVGKVNSGNQLLPPEDFAFIIELEQKLDKSGITRSPLEKL
ncbi:DUF4336 domain-containing protein [Planktothrix sp. FACHB-1355]|uniref:DUF4336 domain-containing protein n=1 Tax=Aerosakkonema funiforme FACHB-1375 TaxID=2949571 RepID=A0A926VCB0_9CYAN|nr:MULTISPECIES: DUF4336 domain-containing protein [Oscillatoriales]MBD2181060.1 DUF4336 domain-containing protein [Aerosakkonema funiforme FACHB-1375]MBD3558809.1 DUF4336 domain-containing protein [Planktothrix sp. FACHB-1355]